MVDNGRWFLDDAIEFSVLTSLCLFGMSLLVEILVLVFSPLLQDSLTWKEEYSIGCITSLRPFGAALTSSLPGMMHPAKSKKLVGTSKASQLFIKSFILGLSGNFSLYFSRSIKTQSFWQMKLTPLFETSFKLIMFQNNWQNKTNRKSFLKCLEKNVWNLSNW